MSNLIEVDNSTHIWEKISFPKDTLYVLYFSASWCAPCKTQGPIIEKLAENFPKITFIKVVIDKEVVPEEDVARFGVTSVPTILVMRNGDIVQRFAELSTYDRIAAVLGE